MRSGNAAVLCGEGAGAPAADDGLLELHAGLTALQKQLSSRHFYDARGSELFEEITRLPEYYPTRAEREILDAWMPALCLQLKPRSLVELGAGGSAKARVLLDAMRAAGSADAYIPVDVSASFLHAAAAELRSDYPGLRVAPLVADMTHDLPLPSRLPRPAIFAFLGSTIGNFAALAAAALLARIAGQMREDDHLLLGVDLRKEVSTIEAAYNDTMGITAEFNRNALRVVNEQFGTDFDPDAFDHRAFYSRTAQRIEMHLVSRHEQAVHVPGLGVVAFSTGETIRTEISCKYDRPAVERLLTAAGLRLEQWRTDGQGRFALALAAIR